MGAAPASCLSPGPGKSEEPALVSLGGSLCHNGVVHGADEIKAQVPNARTEQSRAELDEALEST